MNADERRAAVEEHLRDMNPGAVYYDSLDGALVGWATQQYGPPLAVYDFDEIIEILTEDGTSEEDAIDHFGFNIEGTYAGEGTPLILHRIVDEEGVPVLLPRVPDLPEPDGAEGLGDVPPVREEEPRMGPL